MSDDGSAPAAHGVRPPPDAPPAPTPRDDEPAAGSEHYALYTAVRNAIFALPSDFRSDLNISGVPVTDLQSFNTSLGASIESQTVETLNGMRQVWDSEGTYAGYLFVRQAQQFPDVILKATGPDSRPQILMGIELKGWYVTSREAAPSFRYQVTKRVCADRDLLVVVPWALSNVVSGTPRLFKPYVVSARFAARSRNWHWQHKRQARSDPGIETSQVDRNYPSKSDTILDKPLSDPGNNFGRYARAGLMDDYIAGVFETTLYGIPLRHRQQFFRTITEAASQDDVARRIAALTSDAAAAYGRLSPEAATDIRQSVLALLETLLGERPDSAAERPRRPRRSTS